jgi:LacI family transcriptional regulator
MLAAQEALPEQQRIRTFRDSSPANPDHFRTWFDNSRPDVILSLHDNVVPWLEDCGVTAPDDVGLIQLEWRESQPHLAGMNQHHHQAGHAAVEMVVNEIHRNSKGVPDVPLATLVGATWMDGSSVKLKGWEQRSRAEEERLILAGNGGRNGCVVAAFSRVPLAGVQPLSRAMQF